MGRALYYEGVRIFYCISNARASSCGILARRRGAPYLMEKSCIPGSFLVDLNCFPSPDSAASTNSSSMFAVLSKAPDARRPCTKGELCLCYR